MPILRRTDKKSHRQSLPQIRNVTLDSLITFHLGRVPEGERMGGAASIRFHPLIRYKVR